MADAVFSAEIAHETIQIFIPVLLAAVVCYHRQTANVGEEIQVLLYQIQQAVPVHREVLTQIGRRVYHTV
jgi:hypothetical protein